MKRNIAFFATVAISVIAVASYISWRNHSSINSQIQSVIQAKIDAAITEYNAKGATAILINARNGQIVAMYSAPEEATVTNQLFEFGSILSLFNPILASENGIDINKKYDVSKPFAPTDKNGVPIFTMRDTFDAKQQKMNIPEIVINASNVGNAKLALELPNSVYNELFRRLHMDASLNLDFGRIVAPNIPKDWHAADHANAALGYGVFITPIHLISAINSLINGGKYVIPTLKSPKSAENVIASEHSKIIRDIMHKIAYSVWGDDINVGLKTATAYQNNTKDVVTTVFVAFPIDNPKYSLLVIVNRPDQQHKMAAWNAVPLTKSILSEIMPML